MEIQMANKIIEENDTILKNIEAMSAELKKMAEEMRRIA